MESIFPADELAAQAQTLTHVSAANARRALYLSKQALRVTWETLGPERLVDPSVPCLTSAAGQELTESANAFLGDERPARFGAPGHG